MRYIITFFAISAFILLSSQTIRYSSTVQLPYQGQPMWVQMNDTNGIEIVYIFFDPVTKRTIARGNIQEGLQRLNDVYDQTLVPAQELNYAASRVRLYLNTNGTVKRRDSLTIAIRAYDSTKTKWGIIE